jgi:hypothetical protein
MNILIIAALGLACLYLLKRVYDGRIENALLRDQNASLKRQLSRLRG